MITQENVPYTADEIRAMVKTIEELRKKYNKALERAKYALTTDMDNSGHWAVNYIFPELKESENERIRKAIISCCIDHGSKYKYLGVSMDEMCAWLEKQGFSKEQTNLPCFTFDDVLALQCCMETVKKVQEDKELYEKLNDLYSKVYDACQLEKQGERKSTEDTKKLDPDKVIAWLVANICDFEYYVKLFKQDFKLWNKKN